MGELLALISALFFGATHFLNGLLARRLDSAAVALVGQLGGTVVAFAVAPLFSASHVSASAVAWGALSGLGTGIGVAFLYRGMGRGHFSIIVPLSDVAAIALPVLVGVALRGERPGLLAWVGIAASLPALWLITRRSGPDENGGTASGISDGLIAGIGFALQFIAIAQADEAAGLWPLAASRAASVLCLLPLIVRKPATLRASARSILACLGVGILGTMAMTLYTLATRAQLLSLTVVLTALYPAIPVLLGIIVLRERLNRIQITGLICAGAAIALISAP